VVIQQIDIKHYSIPFVSPMITAGQTYFSREGFIVTIRAGNFLGYGEIAPLPGFSRENEQQCLEAIEHIKNDISQTTTDYSVNELFEIVDNQTNETPSVKFGFETAVLDIVAKMENLPFAKYLNRGANDFIDVNAILGVTPNIWKDPIIKIKVGIKSIEEEIELLQMLKMKFGEDVKFRLDANGSMDFQKSSQFCNDIKHFKTDYFEQPLPKDDLDGLAELRHQTKIPIAVDESLTDFISAQKIIEMQSSDVFIIKPMVCGGFRETQKIIEIAKHHNIRTVVTSSLETAIGRAAICHLISANQITECCGLDTGHLLVHDVATFPESKNGIITLPSSPGLGIKELKL